MGAKTHLTKDYAAGLKLGREGEKSFEEGAESQVKRGGKEREFGVGRGVVVEFGDKFQAKVFFCFLLFFIVFLFLFLFFYSYFFILINIINNFLSIYSFLSYSSLPSSRSSRSLKVLASVSFAPKFETKNPKKPKKHKKEKKMKKWKILIGKMEKKKRRRRGKRVERSGIRARFCVLVLGNCWGMEKSVILLRNFTWVPFKCAGL